MEDTKVIANLPNLEIEIRHRASPEENAEAMSIHLRATPSFDAVLANFFPALTTLPAMHPMGLWLRAVEAAWQPWLQAVGYSSLPPRVEDKT